MYRSELEPLADRFLEVLNTQDYTKLHGLFAPNFRRVAPDQNVDGPEEMEAFIRQIHAAYPDFHVVKDESLYGDDVSFLQWTVTGTATSENGTKAKVELPGITMFRYADGMITREIVQFDAADMMRQLDASAMPHAR